MNKYINTYKSPTTFQEYNRPLYRLSKKIQKKVMDIFYDKYNERNKKGSVAITAQEIADKIGIEKIEAWNILEYLVKHGELNDCLGDYRWYPDEYIDTKYHIIDKAIERGK